MTSCAEFLLLGVDGWKETGDQGLQVPCPKGKEGARIGNIKEQTEAPTR